MWDALQGQNVKKQTGSGSPSGPAGGDLAGTYPNPSVIAVDGVPFDTTPPTSGNILVADGTGFNSVPMSGDATIDAAGVVTVSGSSSGTPGATGPPGQDGEDGEPGMMGPPGNQGPAGHFGGKRQMGWFIALANQNTLNFIGLSTATPASFVVDNAAGAGNTTLADGVFAAESSTSGTAAGWRLPTVCQYRHQPILDMKIRTGASVADQRLWFGFFSTLPTTTDDPVGHVAAFRFSTIAGDTNWRCLTKDNTTLNNQDSGVVVVADTTYILRIDATSSTEIRFYINNILVKTLTANLPNNATDFNVVERILATTATLRTILMNYSYLETY